MNLSLAFTNSVQRDPKKIALFWGDAEFTYAELETHSWSVATRLTQDFGVAPGDRVGIWLKNCPEFVPALFGILHAGGVVVPINNFLKPGEVQYILADAGITTLISDNSMADSLAALQSSNPGLRILLADAISAAPMESVAPDNRLSIRNPKSEIRNSSAPSPRAHLDTGTLLLFTSLSPPAGREPERGVRSFGGAVSKCTPSPLAVIIYTSGTTGHPKGAMLSHGNLLANIESCRIVLEAVGDDRFALLLPMFHSFMLTVCILLPLTVGGSIVLVKSLHPAKNILQEVIRHRATILPAVPQFFRAMAHGGVPPGLPLRVCISGGAPLPGEILKEFTERFPVPLLEGYGLSEASPVVSFNPILGPWKAGSIGVPIPNVDVSVQNDMGEILGTGQTGEICVRGTNVMQGYWNQPAETAKVFRHGWLLTGDVGHRDPEGYFYITDRKKDMLLVNGNNVYPREIEEVLYQFPGVRETAVIGRPDSRKGEQPLAFVAPNEGVTLQAADLLKFLRERLADYKLPRQVIVLPNLPRNATGKILKTDLRTRLAAGQFPDESASRRE
jgi:long-chain acyl-CoA synthetase